MKTYILSIASVLWLLLGANTTLFAKGVELQVSSSEIQVGETVQVTYLFTNVKVGQFTPPSFEGFAVSGPMTSSSMNIINGDVTRSKSVTYVLQGIRPGVYQIKSGKAEVEGKMVKTPAFTITVKGNGAQGNSSSNPSPNSSSPSSGRWQDNIFLRAVADKNTAFAGEQIIVDFQLCTRLDYLPEEITKLPVFNGFLMEEMQVPDNEKESFTTINGRQFLVQTFKRFAIFANQEGDKTIEGLTLRGTVYLPGDPSAFPGSLLNQADPKVIDLTTKPLKIKIKPLPVAPESFKGAVGKYDVQYYYDKNQLAAGEPLQLKIYLEGIGNIKMISPPEIQLPESVEIYDPKIREEIEPKGKILKGAKEFVYTLVPEEEGDFEIPSIEISFFDPETGTYYNKNIPAQSLTIRGKAKQAYQAPVVHQLKGNINKQLKNNWTPIEKEIPTGWIIVGCGTISLALIGLFLFLKRRKHKTVENNVIHNEDVFQEVTFLIENHKEKEAIAAIAKIFRRKINNLSESNEIAKEEIFLNTLLKENEEKGKRLQKLLADCDMSAYSPLLTLSASEALIEAQKLYFEIFPKEKTTQS